MAYARMLLASFSPVLGKIASGKRGRLSRILKFSCHCDVNLTSYMKLRLSIFLDPYECSPCLSPLTQP